MPSITIVITMAAALSFWLTPMPQHAEGWIVNYGNERALVSNAYFRGYDPAPYKCFGSMMSPVDLGKIFWVRTESHPGWLGPCLDVDAGQRIHFLSLVIEKHEIVEIGETDNKTLTGSDFGGVGELWVGDCPPKYGEEGKASYYDRRLTPDKVDTADPDGSTGYAMSFYPFPKQHFPVGCFTTGPRQAPLYWRSVFTDFGLVQRIGMSRTMPVLAGLIFDSRPKVCYNTPAAKKADNTNAESDVLYAWQGPMLRGLSR